MQTASPFTLPRGQAGDARPAGQALSWNFMSVAQPPDSKVASGAETSAVLREEANVVPCDVLVVDDDPSILYLVSQALELEGHSVTTASNGQEALEAVTRAQPQVALLDMRMPLLDGWGFAQAVKERGIPLKIVVMTATTDARRWAEEIGADGYLGKPFGLDDVLSIVDRMCHS